MNRRCFRNFICLSRHQRQCTPLGPQSDFEAPTRPRMEFFIDWAFRYTISNRVALNPNICLENLNFCRRRSEFE
jgi:hypothetical protein